MKPSTRRHMLGWVRDLPDARDHVYSAPLARLRALPTAVDLRPQFRAAPYDQGRIGSCTANAIAGAIQFDRQRAGQRPDFTPSRLFVYFYERSIERSVPADAGAQLRDGIKVVATMGAPPESAWPYDDTPADPTTQLFPRRALAVKVPTTSVLKLATQHTVKTYSRLTQSLSQLKGCLADGFPFVFGFTVYSSLWDARGNPRVEVPMPSADDGVEGGHAVLAVGYDDARRALIVRNSWGSSVQERGHFYLPYGYATDPQFASDFWTIRAVAR